MSKAEQFIKDYTRHCSNELCYEEGLGNLYEPWITPEQALAAVEIAREEMIDTLEVKKEVDLYEELDVYFAQFKGLEKSYWNWRIDSVNIHAQGIYDFAKHFFELGLKAQKGE